MPLPGGINSILKFYLRIIPTTLTLIPQILRADLVEARLYGNVGLLGLLLAKLLRKPTIVQISGDYEDTVKLDRAASIKGKLYNLYLSLSVRAANLMIRDTLNFVFGGSLYKKFTERGIKVHEMLLGIAGENDLRKDHHDTCRGNAVSILYAGRLIAPKGVNHTIDALVEVKKRHKNTRLVIVGEGPAKGDLKAQVKRLNLEHDVKFTGYIPYGPDLIEEYRRADCFVLASFSEGFPKVLLEAMSQGIPIVTTAVGGIPFLIKHEENGLLVPPKDPDALADAVCKIIEEPETRRRLIRNGLKTAESHTVEKATAKFISAVRERYPDCVRPASATQTSD
ncbi:MAG: glycosyltransferase [bacterium]